MKIGLSTRYFHLNKAKQWFFSYFRSWNYFYLRFGKWGFLSGCSSKWRMDWCQKNLFFRENFLLFYSSESLYLLEHTRKTWIELLPTTKLVQIPSNLTVKPLPRDQTPIRNQFPTAQFYSIRFPILIWHKNSTIKLIIGFPPLFSQHIHTNCIQKLYLLLID